MNPSLKKLLVKLGATRPRNKYRVAPVEDRTSAGVVFASRGEMKRWRELDLQQRGGQIFGLERQRKYALMVNGVNIGSYIADFCYTRLDGHGGELAIVEDFKGVRTPEYKIKAKLMFAIHGITILETGAKK